MQNVESLPMLFYTYIPYSYNCMEQFGMQVTLWVNDGYAYVLEFKNSKCVKKMEMIVLCSVANCLYLCINQGIVSKDGTSWVNYL
jgi:hypothetical protein